VLPSACRSSGVARLPVHAGQLPAERRLISGLVHRGGQPMGFVAVAGAESFLFLGDEVFALVGAPTAAEDAVALFYLMPHGDEHERIRSAGVSE
jgi:hypothetical protein